MKKFKAIVYALTVGIAFFTLCAGAYLLIANYGTWVFITLILLSGIVLMLQVYEDVMNPFVTHYMGNDIGEDRSMKSEQRNEKC